MQVKGHVAIVTGGGSGLGRACALMLAQEGANVVIADINPEAGPKVVAEVKKLGRDAFSLPTDSCNKAQVHKIVQERSEERRVGKECTSWCRSRWSPST